MPGQDKVRALVLSGFGLNCDNETAHALNLAGAAASIVHISDLTGTAKRSPTETLDDYQILVFDGGFAWGDDHGAGVLLATRLGNHLNSQLRSFLDRGGLVLGICNGFQALVNLGLLPMLRGWERQVALIANDCGNFQDRWVELLAQENSPCLFTKGLGRVDMPVRHGEGKFVCDDETLQKLEDLGMVAVRYGDGKGKPAQGRRPGKIQGVGRFVVAVEPEAAEHPGQGLGQPGSFGRAEGRAGRGPVLGEPAGPQANFGSFLRAGWRVRRRL